MPSLLKSAYPALKLDAICRACLGNSEKWCKKPRCVVCKKSRLAYEREGLLSEVREYDFLRETWLKCKQYNQISTGYKQLDFLITRLFGVPHERGWRDYKQLKKPPIDTTCLRNVGNVNEPDDLKDRQVRVSDSES